MVFRLPGLGVVTSEDFGALAFVVLFCCFVGGMVGYCCGCSDPSAPTVNPLWGIKKDDGDAISAEEGKTKQPAPPTLQQANVTERQYKAQQKAIANNSRSKKDQTKSEKLDADLERKRAGRNSKRGIVNGDEEAPRKKSSALFKDKGTHV